MSLAAQPDRRVDGTESVKALHLYGGVTATVSGDQAKEWVFLSIADAANGAPFTLRIPSREASDLAVLLVNAANGL